MTEKEPVISKRYALAHSCPGWHDRLNEWFGDRKYAGAYEIWGRIFMLDSPPLSASEATKWLIDHGALNDRHRLAGKSLIYCPKPGEKIGDELELEEARKKYGNNIAADSNGDNWVMHEVAWNITCTNPVEDRLDSIEKQLDAIAERLSKLQKSKYDEFLSNLSDIQKNAFDKHMADMIANLPADPFKPAKEGK